MAGLFKRDENRVLRLAREATTLEIKNARLLNNKVFVLSKDLGDDKKYVRFFHFNRVGKKIYRTSRDKIQMIKIKRDKPSNVATIGDIIDEETLEKLRKFSDKLTKD